MPLRIIHGDITEIRADAIVNSANPYPICGGSTEGCIYDAADYDLLLDARRQVGYLDVCDVAITPAFHLDAMYLIHVSAPRWNGGHSGEKVALRICYQKVLKKAQEAGCRSIAFSLLSSGAYRFPKDVALTIAKESIEEYLKVYAPDGTSESMNVMLVLYDDEAIKVSENLFNEIERYIDSNYIPDDDISLSSQNFSLTCIQPAASSEALEKCSIKSRTDFNKNIQELLSAPENQKQFRDRMNELMKERNISAATIEKDGNIDRKHFSKINSNKVHPSKGAVIAIAIGLKLNYIETVDFLAYAGFALSPSSKSDLIVRFFMENRDIFYREDSNRNQYKVMVLNDLLMAHGENTLGAGRDLKPL